MTRFGTFDPALLDLLEGSAIDAPFSASFWRQVLGDTDPLTPNVRGARWNPPDVEALYCASSEAGVKAEIDHLISCQPVAITRVRKTYPLRVRLDRVIDLRTNLASTGLKTLSDDLGSIRECQRVGAAAAWLEFEGLLVPSLRTQAVNLVIFTSCLGPNALIEIASSGDN